MFHEIARVLWGVDTVSLMSTQTNTRAELYQFQDLIQNLVSLEYETDLSPISSGTRLRTAQRKVQTRNRHMHRPCRSHQSRLSAGSSFHNIGSVLAQLTMDSDSNSDDEIDMNDFVHLDAPSLEARPHFNPKPTSAPACTSWKNVHPIVVLLLASVAFSVVLTMISGKFQMEFETFGAVIHLLTLISHPRRGRIPERPGFSRDTTRIRAVLRHCQRLPQFPPGVGRSVGL